MNRKLKTTTILAFSLLALAATPPVGALEWSTSASLMAVLAPNPDPQDVRVNARGFHRIYISEISIADTYLPVRMRIKSGALEEERSVVRQCSTGWVWAYDDLSVACVTIIKDRPCRWAAWHASTAGRLQGHPKGGTKLSYSKASFINCECV